MGKIANIPGAVLFIRTADHCPPHAHASSAQQGWEIRVFFSYASDDLDWEIKWGQPSKREIEDCMAEVWARIEDCRAQWWRDLNKVCLDNKQVEIKGGVIRELPPQKAVKVTRPSQITRGPKGKAKAAKTSGTPTVLTVKPKSATYDAAQKSVDFVALGSSAKHTGKCP